MDAFGKLADMCTKAVSFQQCGIQNEMFGTMDSGETGFQGPGPAGWYGGGQSGKVDHVQRAGKSRPGIGSAGV